MGKRLFISAVSLLLTGVCYAQWSAQDSLKLQKLLEGSEELKLNPKAVKQIDFGGAVGTPRMSEEKRWMLPDESLPEALPKPKVVLTLMPYKANTRYNWDPVYQKKIRVNKNTWRGDPFYEYPVFFQFLSTNCVGRDSIRTGHVTGKRMKYG